MRKRDLKNNSILHSLKKNKITRNKPTLGDRKNLYSESYKMLIKKIKDDTKIVERYHILGLPWWLSGKEFTFNEETTGDTGSILGSGKSLGRGHDNLLQYTYLENPDKQRSLAGYSPLGHKESDTTEVS